MRIRPANFSESRDQTVKKVSDDSIFVEDRKFEFDSVLDSNSKQVWILASTILPMQDLFFLFNLLNSPIIITVKILKNL